LKNNIQKGRDRSEVNGRTINDTDCYRCAYCAAISRLPDSENHFQDYQMAFSFDTVSFYRKTVLCRPITLKRLVNESASTAGNPVSELAPSAAFTGEAA